ncbi:phosphatase PAP2 family protein [Actinotalea sp. K2]|uniref:phosphatase PAP2 family protein n=1 Tax=Actinotalea sp. K2 TaxID=2939438 RepID=UPI002017F845|nr:phosphatase PAP2 family protein [Actinotalea sp. K2]MCL3861385.1 phosphatase PAP2 family protein [Actinotalea sp. K2]
MSAPPSFPPARGGPAAPGHADAPPAGPALEGGRAPQRRQGGREVRAGHLAPAIVVAAVSAVGVWAVWRVFVGSLTGQRLEEAAFEGAALGQHRLWQVAEPVLEIISVPFIAGVLVATMLLAVLRRRMLLALQVAVLMGGANLTTQLLKHVVFDRPDLGVGVSLANALPSGHTTAAASVAAALLFVVPRRMRPAAALIGAMYAAATGVSTLVGRWHRPSDVVAAVLVVLVWAGIATALSVRGDVAAGPDRPGRSRAVVGLLSLAGVTALIGGGLALQRSAAHLDAGLTSTTDLLTAYGGGALSVVGVTFLAFAVLLALRRATEPRTAV